MLHWTALVTVAAILVYFYIALAVAKARQKFGVPAPAMSGNPDFERIFRVQMNTLEWMPIFLPLLWLCAYYMSDRGAAIIGLIWIVGRILYMRGYAVAADRRETGFRIQGFACAVLLIGALAGIIPALIHSP